MKCFMGEREPKYYDRRELLFLPGLLSIFNDPDIDLQCLYQKGRPKSNLCAHYRPISVKQTQAIDLLLSWDSFTVTFINSINTIEYIAPINFQALWHDPHRSFCIRLVESQPGYRPSMEPLYHCRLGSSRMTTRDPQLGV